MMRRPRPGTSRAKSRLHFRALRGTPRAPAFAVLAAVALLTAGCEDTSGPSGPAPVTLVEAGPNHTCAIVDGDRTYCWGDDRFGQLGADMDASCRGRDCRRPVPLEGSLPFETLGLGEFHTCGIANLQAYCWGFDRFGQLGSDDMVPEHCRLSPSLRCAVVPRRAAVGFPMVDITAASTHSCGVASGGQLFCWGRNGGMQLGTGDTQHRRRPTTLETTLAFTSVTTGTGHTCGIVQSSDAYCWGQGVVGQLGNGDRQEQPAPTRVGGETGSRLWSRLDAGGRHTCGAETDNVTVSCWGRNNEGQLGLGDFTSRDLPAPVDIPGGSALISAGDLHTCAVALSGDLYCWGRNTRGQLGLGTTGRELTPTRVPLPSPALSVSAGDSHTCAITRDGALYCWGSNDFGELGDGTTTDRSSPVRIDF